MLSQSFVLRRSKNFVLRRSNLTTFHAGSEHLLVCVVINNSSYPTVKNNNAAYLAFGKYLVQARGFLNYRLKYCWPKVMYCICQPNKLKREIKKKTGEASRQPSKNLGRHGPPSPPLRIATVAEYSKPTQTLGKCESHCHSGRIHLELGLTRKIQRKLSCDENLYAFLTSPSMFYENS